MSLPTDSTARKGIPIVTGVLDYFTAALAEVAVISRIGNEKHNPGQPLHWSRGKSTDHADCIGRHLAQRGTVEIETINGVDYRVRHSAQLAWRALALLQEELEAEGALPSRGSVFPDPPTPTTNLNEWQTWAGNGIPPELKPDTVVEILTRGGTTDTITAINGRWNWIEESGRSSDIVRYRVVTGPTPAA